MKKVFSFALGSVVGLGAGLIAASMLLPDDTEDELKKKISENDKIQNLKEKYNKGTEVLRTQLKSFPKSVDDDSELKDFDDIVIDGSADDLGEDEKEDREAISDLSNAETDKN